MTADDYAKAIIGEGQRRGITPRGIQIALAVALVESNLTMYANNAVPESLNFPHDAVGSDGTSVGLFQQQNFAEWGTLACRMDPACSAGTFYQHLVAYSYDSDDHTPGYYGQAVQRSAYPDRYDQRIDDAIHLYNRLAGAPPPPGPRFYPQLAHDVFRQHLGEPYVYGGLDCSGLVDYELTALTTGTVDGWTRHVTTESWNPDMPVGGQGPFHSVRVTLPLPADAIATIAIHHGGGGPDSHMNVRIDGELMESNGDHGICSEGHGAILQTDDYWTDWWAIYGGTPSEPGGFLMALSAEQQQEIYDKITTIWDSRSPFRHLAEHRRDDTVGFLLNADSNIHAMIVTLFAAYGDPLSLSILHEIATADPAKYPDRQQDARLAQLILARITGAPAPTPTPAPAPTPTPTPVPNPSQPGDPLNTNQEAIAKQIEDRIIAQIEAVAPHLIDEILGALNRPKG